MKNTQPNNQELKRIFVSIIILGPLAVTMMDSRPLVSAICIAFILMLLKLSDFYDLCPSG